MDTWPWRVLSANRQYGFDFQAKQLYRHALATDSHPLKYCGFNNFISAASAAFFNYPVRHTENFVIPLLIEGCLHGDKSYSSRLASMYAFELSLKYRLAVKERNLDAILSMFAPDAVIETPLKGCCEVKPYHEWLFASVKKSTVEVQNVFQALNGDISIAVHSRYRWLLNNDKVIEFGGMSLFEFTPDRTKIRKMTTFYDASLVRSLLAQTNLLT